MANKVWPLSLRCAAFAIYFGGRIDSKLLAHMLGVSTSHLISFCRAKDVWKEHERLKLEGMFEEYVTDDMKAELKRLGYEYNPWSNWK